jgi:NADPH-dependent 7-cyano-7-deazaguanine reductase QueF
MSELIALPFNKLSAGKMVIQFNSRELTSKCPLADDTDFFNVSIQYVPGKFILEALSIQKYLRKFRDIKITAEELADTIFIDVSAKINPVELTITLNEESNSRDYVLQKVEVSL